MLFRSRGVIKTVSEAHGGQGMLEFVNPNPPESIYWSSREYAGDTRLAWALGFSGGGQSPNNKLNFFAVRCLRAF